MVDAAVEQHIYSEATRRGLIKDKLWRLNNLYFVKNVVGGQPVRFKMTEDHREVYNLIHGGSPSQNILTVKARQVFMTTFVCVYMIDTCMFENNRECLVSNYTIPEAERTVKHIIHFVCNNTPHVNRAVRPEYLVANGAQFPRTQSKVEVSMFGRGGKADIVLITEFAKASNELPRKAKEVTSGMLPAAEYGIVIIESTGKGNRGPFPEMIETAQAVRASGRELTRKDFNLLFIGWWRKHANRIFTENGQRLYDRELAEYFERVEKEERIRLSDPQRNWYAVTLSSEHSGDRTEMQFEHPSTISEAISVDVRGFVLAREMRQLEVENRLSELPVLPHVPVVTFWDIGWADPTAVLFVQKHPDTGFYHVIDALKASEKPLDYFFSVMRNKQYDYGYCVLPWDGGPNRSSHVRKVLGDRADDLESVERRFEEAGYTLTAVMPKVRYKAAGIAAAKNEIRHFRIGKQLGEVIRDLNNVQYKFVKEAGVYADELDRADPARHYYDCFENACRSVRLFPQFFEPVVRAPQTQGIYTEERRTAQLRRLYSGI